MFKPASHGSIESFNDFLKAIAVGAIDAARRRVCFTIAEG
jgi:hypothetical protein